MHDDAGKPLPGAKVEIRSIHFPSARTNMASEFLPDELSLHLAVTTGTNGKADFRGSAIAISSSSHG